MLCKAMEFEFEKLKLGAQAEDRKAETEGIRLAADVEAR